jgi:two-component system CheB/CheR fusion protein
LLLNIFEVLLENGQRTAKIVEPITQQTQESEHEELAIKSQLDFPIVGIGASAGGLEAVTSMFQNVEAGVGMAFVLVMHLDPHHESMMAELLSSKTHIPVRQISDKDHVEVDCLHVIPPGAALRIEDGKFRLDPFSLPRGLRRPIDSFFTSLASVQGDRAACVVLSGTGGDGTAGMRIIKELGGICAVQSPEEARYDGMPFSALSTNLVDFTLPASDLVDRVQAFFNGALTLRFPEDEPSAQLAMGRIIEVLRNRLGNDFSGYKTSTLFRRLNRRLQVLEFTDIDTYIEHLKEDANEQQALADDFLINVTSFFREREYFELLRKTVLLPLIENCDASEELRIWVPGCSSGQEAYSIAMMVDDICEQLDHRPLVQIFATDISLGVIDAARKARYPVSMLSEIPQKYRDNYIVGMDERFEIISRIREMVRFSVHNLIQDAPFSKIDLITCRNLLIYLGDELQAEIFPLMHFSLRPGGFLFLGTSESVSKREDLFVPIDQKARLFKRQDSAKRSHISLPLGSAGNERRPNHHNRRMAKELDFPRHQSLNATNATIYEHYAPPFVRVTANGVIIDSSGDLSLFMMSRPGDERSLDVLAREGVRDVVMPLVSDAMKSRSRKAVKDIPVNSQFGTNKADIIAHPMKDDTVALIFVVKGRLEPVVNEYEVSPVTRDRQIADLQEDIQATRLMLKSKVEEVETANEELKSSNEEMMSMNEELQSANEELTTANEELKNKIDELTLANSDLDNFLQSADLAMIVLDRSMRIRHVTDAARQKLPITRSDEGRALTEFNINLGSFDPTGKVREVIETGESFSKTTEPDEQGQSFFLRITPYFFADGSVEGASITLTDISQEVALRSELATETEKLRLAMKGAHLGFWETDLESDELRLDEVAGELTGLDHRKTYPRDALASLLRPADMEDFKKLREEAISSGEGYSYLGAMEREGKMRHVQVYAQPFKMGDGRNRVAGVGFDVSRTIQLQQQLEDETRRMRLALSTGQMGLALLDVETRVTTADAILAEQLNLPEAGDYLPEELTVFIEDDDVPLIDENLSKAIEFGEEYAFDYRVDVPGKDIRHFHSRGFLFVGEDGRKKVVATVVEITDDRRQKMLLSEMSHRIKNLFAVIGGLIQAAPKQEAETILLAEELIGKIAALGSVYDLARKNPAMPGIDLRELLVAVLKPHALGHAIELKGPNVFVDQNALNTLTLIFHELATNAIKHGALSTPKGKLRVTWSNTKSRATKLCWRETVPGFSIPQKGEAEPGFGTQLIQSSIRQLHGTVKSSWTKTGAKIDLSLEVSDRENMTK